jgi:hypothetical protein
MISPETIQRLKFSAHEKLSGGRNVRVHLFVRGSFYLRSRFGE